LLSDTLLDGFTKVALSPEPDLAAAALMIARVEYPKLDASRTSELLDRLGRRQPRGGRCACRFDGHADQVDPSSMPRVAALNEHLFKDQGFVGNETSTRTRGTASQRVLEREPAFRFRSRSSIGGRPRAGSSPKASTFRATSWSAVRPLAAIAALRRAPRQGPHRRRLHGGAFLSEDACLSLLRRHAGEDAAWDRAEISSRATKPQILGRMLLNLKRLYVRMPSFPQARDVTELLLAVDPSGFNELRDRGLLADHLHDFSGALRDLQSYLKFSSRAGLDEDERDEQAQIWEHVKMLRRRVASLN
jgi:regulator of sirC expression with transglutaminase-like and TPR domain